MCEIKQSNVDGMNDNCLKSENSDSGPPVLLKFWEIENMFKCPVVGMCLTSSEQKQVLKKAGISIKNKSAFEIHEQLVANSDDENRLSKKVDNLLNRKFGRQAIKMLGLGPQKFLGHWRRAFETDGFQAALWATATSPDLPVEFRREIFGDVHMTMHWTANQSIKLKQKLAVQQERILAMDAASRAAAADRRELRKKNSRLTKTEAGLRAQLAALETEKSKLLEILDDFKNQPRLKSLERENQELQQNMKDASRNLKANQRRAALLKTQNVWLSKELKQQKELARHLSEEVGEIIKTTFDMQHCEESCPTFDLCQKRVLIVGGMTRMEALYRRLIEDSGGIFEYHDGYMKKGTKMLENRLRRADMVLCPVNCNSHAACSLVKNLAKKHNKPLHMLANSSLSTVSQVIRGNTADHAVIN